MSYPQAFLHPVTDRSRRGLVYGILSIWGLVAISFLTVIFSEIGLGDQSSKYYLLPWCLVTGAVVIIPSMYLVYKGRFDPFHPLVFPAWSYFFPGFFIGGLLLTAGLSQPYFLSLVPDESYNLPLTLVYVMLGYVGLVAGFAIPYARRVGEWIAKHLPRWPLLNERVAVPGLLLMAIGMGYTLVGFAQGLLGFQKVQEIGAFDGIVFLLSLFWLEASFLLWLYVFRSPRIAFWQGLVIAVLVITALTKSVFQGNRGSFIQFLILIAFAFVLSGKKLTIRFYAVGGMLAVAGLLGGMIYGTTFRSVKESQDQVSLDRYIAVVPATFDRLSEQDIGTVLVNGFSALAERVDAVSSLAVVVSNYEALAPYEESWGINDNIYVDTVTFFIPRVVWPDKPISIDPGKYGDLYFNYSENSFTITPMGDLLRNFGPFGVPIGMIILGFLIRIVYAALIENQPFEYWRATLFYMIYANISFEGTYGLIIPTVSKIAVFSILGLLIVRFFAGTTKRIQGSFAAG